jgi:hypothetical protein
LKEVSFEVEECSLGPGRLQEEEKASLEEGSLESKVPFREYFLPGGFE